MRMKRAQYLSILVFGALLIRLGAVAALRDWQEGPSHRLGADGVDYDQLARQIALGHGYVWSPGNPTSFRAPGFPLFLAGLYRTLGFHYPPAYASFCILGALSCLLTYFLAREFVGEFAARAAGVLAAVYCPHVYMATSFYSENVFIPCMALGVWLFLRHLKTGSLGALVLAGLALGWATLTRPYTLLMIPVLLSVLAWDRLRWRPGRFPAAALVLVASFLVVIAPWAIRNQRVHGRPVLIATIGGSTFYGGNNDRVLNERPYLGYWTLDNLPGRDPLNPPLDEVANDQRDWRLGVAWLRGHLGSLPRLWVYKFLRLWLPDVASANRTYVRLQVVTYTPFLCLFVTGAVRSA